MLKIDHIFCNHLAKLLQKDSRIPENQHMIYVEDRQYLLYHLAKLLQKDSIKKIEASYSMAHVANTNCAISRPPSTSVATKKLRDFTTT
jgi:hypothetical protein